MQVAWYALLAIIGVAVSEVVPSRVSQVQEALASNQNAGAAVNWNMLETNP
jgi:hypothetical protein